MPSPRSKIGVFLTTAASTTSGCWGLCATICALAGGGGRLHTHHATRTRLLPDPEKRLKRKIIEIAITFQLENRFNKQQIFQLYANEIPLGQQGSFAINGFGQAAQTYFGKDVRQLDLAQCAMLAGMIQRPSYLNPYRHPERALQRRNMVLDAMVETGKITKEEAIEAKAEPLKLAPDQHRCRRGAIFRRPGTRPAGAAHGRYRFQSSGLRIYTSLDPDLQRSRI